MTGPGGLPAAARRRGGPAIALTQPMMGALQGDLLALFTKAAVKFTAFDIEKDFVLKFLTDRCARRCLLPLRACSPLARYISACGPR